MRRVVQTIALTPTEKRLFALLVDVAKRRSPGTTVRVAGGWVRDKLLGLPGRDIDIVLDDTSGARFAKHVVAHQRAAASRGGRGKRHRAPATTGFGVIRANPDQSKHLETVAMTILGEPIDINCFRTDDYSQTSSSRIPSTRVGTATEDAHRRDFTLNALFFNVTESVRRGTSSTDACVEDLTGRGLDDLEHGLLRTPLAAFETLRDDPLRLLRGVRFACTFGFAIDPPFAEAAQLPEVVAALATKVSRERVGIELRKVFASDDPARGFALLDAYGVRDSVFKPCTGSRGVADPATLTTFWPTSISTATAAAPSWSRTLEHVRRVRELSNAESRSSSGEDGDVNGSDSDDALSAADERTTLVALEVVSAALSHTHPEHPSTTLALAQINEAVAEGRAGEIAQSGRAFPLALQNLVVSYEDLAECVLQHNLKLPRREPRTVARILALSSALHALLLGDRSVDGASPTEACEPAELLKAWRAELSAQPLLAGLWLHAAHAASRDLHLPDGLWRHAARVAATSPVASACWGRDEEGREGDDDVRALALDATNVALLVEELFEPAALVAATQPPLLNGHDVMRVLREGEESRASDNNDDERTKKGKGKGREKGKGGVEVKSALNMLCAYQISSPGATKADAEAWLAHEGVAALQRLN